LAERVACMIEMINAYKIFVPDMKRSSHVRDLGVDRRYTECFTTLERNYRR
jgi:hypothetical protein